MPFYVAAPLSTIDLATPHGGGIPIEERPAREVTHVGGVAGHAGRRGHPQSGLRRDAGALHHRDHHREGHRPPRLHDQPAAAVRGSRARARLLAARPSAPPRSPQSTAVLILGIESSCDETAAAVVEETGAPDQPWRGPLERHRLAGGDCIASGAASCPNWPRGSTCATSAAWSSSALGDAGVGWRDLGAIAVTQGPGLVGSLLVGLSAAKAVAASLDLPLVAVHHLAGHIESLVLHNGPLPLPAVVLVVSGGHTSLYLMPADGRVPPVGRTRDDAAGEAYDKVAKLLGLGYPGGPVDRPRGEGRQRSRLRPAARQDHPQGPHPSPAPPASARPGSRRRSSIAPTSASAA